MGALYCIISSVLLVIALYVTGLGFAGASELLNEYANSLNIFSLMEGIEAENSLQSFIFFVTMVQTFYISKFFEAFSDKYSETEKTWIYFGNIIMGCFISVMYQSFPHDSLLNLQIFSSMIVVVPTMIVFIILTIYMIVKIGLLKTTLAGCGAMILLVWLGTSPLAILIIPVGIIMIIALIATNPILVGIVAAIAPSMIVLFLFGLAASILPVPGIVLFILSFATSYALTDFFNQLVMNSFQSTAEELYHVINVIFFVFSIVVIGIWVKTVVISPEVHSINIEGNTVEVTDGRVRKHGYLGSEGSWDLYTNGLLDIYPDGNYSYYKEAAFPWDDYKSDIKYITFNASLDELRNRCFFNCKNLQSVSLPAGLKYISKAAFQGCDSLESFDISENNTLYTTEKGVLYSKDKSKLILCPNTKIDQFLPTAEYQADWFIKLRNNKQLIYPCYQWNENKPLLFYSSDFTYSFSYDLNQDGIRELFLSTDKNQNDNDTILLICITPNNKVKCLKALSSAAKFYVLAGNGYVVSFQRVEGRVHYIIEEFSGDSLKLLYDISWKTDDVSGEKIYYINNEKTERSEYSRIYKKYVKRAKRIRFKAIA